MKVIIAGSRSVTDVAIVRKCFDNFYFRFVIEETVCGWARGVDRTGRLVGLERFISSVPFPADWDGPLKKRAGMARNQEMADYADCLLAIWDGVSTGTKDMIDRAVEGGLYVEVWSASGELQDVYNDYWTGRWKHLRKRHKSAP